MRLKHYYTHFGRTGFGNGAAATRSGSDITAQEIQSAFFEMGYSVEAFTPSAEEPALAPGIEEVIVPAPPEVVIAEEEVPVTYYPEEEVLTPTVAPEMIVPTEEVVTPTIPPEVVTPYYPESITPYYREAVTPYYQPEVVPELEVIPTEEEVPTEEAVPSEVEEKKADKAKIAMIAFGLFLLLTMQ